MKRKIKTKKKQIIIFSIVILLLSLTVSFGRYIYNGIKDYYLGTKNFYFNSDKLSVNQARYQIDNWSGVEPFDITINLDSMKNNSVSSNSDIIYTVSYSCSSNLSCSTTKSGGTIYASTNVDDFAITMTPNVTLHDGDRIWMEVSVDAISPYRKSLSGIFIVNVGTPGLSYEVLDEANRPYLDFDITNTLDFYTVQTAFGAYAVGDHIDISTYIALSQQEKDKCVSALITLTFDPNVLRLDMTNEAYLNATSIATQQINGFDYINRITFKVEAISSFIVRFYKINSTNDYSYPFVNPTSIIGFSVN